MKKHLLILLFITVLTRGVMFIGYPLGGIDDDQSAQRFLIDELLRGNLMIGNLRYNTGYPLVISPVVALARPFGRLDDRIVLLVQVILASTIPFAIYDMVRARQNARAALIVALVPALDPFLLQWAHFWLPVWLLACCLTWGLWCIHRARQDKKRAVWWIAAAGMVLGIGCLARWEFAIVVAMLGLSFTGMRSFDWLTRLAMFGTLGTVSAGILLVYLIVIHYPSTGIWKPSCMAGIDGIVSLSRMGIPITADNGPATRQLLNLLTLKPPHEVLFTGVTSYPGWRSPGPWATREEQSAFINQPFGTPEPALTTDFPANLIYYQGLCPTDALLTQVHAEGVGSHPVQWLTGLLVSAGRMLINSPLGSKVGYSEDSLYLARYQDLRLDSTGSNEADLFGFRKARTDYTYTGQVVWVPGIWLLSNLYEPLNALHWLALPAMLWALLTRHRLYLTAALTLVPFFLFVSTFNTIQPRVYGPVYPLTDLLIGGLVAVSIPWLECRLRHRRELNVAA